MAGVSTESLKKVEKVLDANMAVSPTHLAQELFAVVDVIDQDGSLRRALVDPAREENARQGIVKAIFGGKVSVSTLNVLTAAVAARWSEERDLADALEHVAVVAAAIAAQSRGGSISLETVVNQMLTFINSVDSSAEAQQALTSDRASNRAKEKLALVLSGNATEPESVLLIERAASHSRGLTPARLAEKFVQIIVNRQNRSIAKVTVARPLTEVQTAKLRAALVKAYGKDLKLDITQDPSLIGGIRVQVGDEIMDGSVQSRLADLGRSFA